MLGQQGTRSSASVATGKAAIEKVRETRPDLVLLDIRLRGELDGVAVAEAIGKDVAVVFLTAHATTRLSAARTRRNRTATSSTVRRSPAAGHGRDPLLRHHLRRGSWRASAGSRRRSPASTTP